MKKKIAIQGVKGAFHDIVAQLYYGVKNLDVLPCTTFDDVMRSVINDEAEAGVMAIENSVAGSILPNYGLLKEYKVSVCGEVFLRIEQNLLALPGQKLNSIKEVSSHPMALLQCRKFFQEHPEIKLTEAIDTALVAKEIDEKRLWRCGAIGSSYAARIYGLEVIEKGIETNKQNYTRFLILKKKSVEMAAGLIPERASLCFNTPHEVGSLSRVLSVLSYYSINLTKIQSLPILGCEWEYLFYIDLEFSDYERYLQSIEAIRPLTVNLEILGQYSKGKKYYENITIS